MVNRNGHLGNKYLRGRPRTCTAENADLAISPCDCGKDRPLVADLAINPETGQAEPTQVPNQILDHCLKLLSAAELKILLVIIRHTNGWVNCHTGKRKTHDRISHSQFIEDTGLSRRIISQTVSKLQGRGLIAVTDRIGKTRASGRERTGSTHIFYSSTCANGDTDLCTFRHQPVQKGAHNKTNKTKLRERSTGVSSHF